MIKDMGREILFRGKSKKTGEWFFGNLFDKDNSGKTHIGTTTKGCFDIDPETVGQLWMRVGSLKLFDGDIFDFPKHNVRFIVKYNEKRHQFCIAHPDELDLKYFNPWQCPDEKWIESFMKDAVLVGNIHDNPELL